MGDVSVEFKKSTVERGRVIGKKSNTLKIREEKFRQLPLGGHEGRKFFTPLVNPRYRETHKDITPELNFISKEDVHVDESAKMVSVYDQLRKKGYPVPVTTRYFKKDGLTYLMMSDMTEGGKYKIWGYSDSMSEEQIEDLNSMNLNKGEIGQIEKMTFSFADKADTDNITLHYWTYHLRKNLKTGEINIVFLDLSPNTLGPPIIIGGQRLEHNRSQALGFISCLKRYLK